MNKQAITFLSLFTLILVLSVYYLVVPPIDQQANVQTKQLSKIEVLQNQLNENHENTLAENNDVIASAKSSKKQIQEALTSIEKTNADIETENTVEEIVENIKNELTNAKEQLEIAEKRNTERIECELRMFCRT